MRRTLIIALALVSLTAGAQARRRAVRHLPAAVSVRDDFRNGQLGWEAGFADYSPASADMELDARIAPLPQELGIAGTGFMLHGANHSDDLFSFLTKRVSGLQPNQRYLAAFHIVMASNAGGVECIGVGGAPGLGVYLKAGASSERPRIELDALNTFRVVNVDKGNQSSGGANMSVAGNVSNESSDCRSDAPFRTIERSVLHPIAVAANASGEIWLIAGTDSGFEGRQTLYYESIEATLTPVP